MVKFNISNKKETIEYKKHLNKFNLLKIVIFFRPILKKIKIYDFLFKKIMETKEEKFIYSENWYNTTYYNTRLHLKNNNFRNLNNQYEKSNYRTRLENILNHLNLLDQKMNWLEVGCHLGLSAFWIAEKYQQAKLFMFDFSKESIQWCKTTFPYKERAIIWQTSIDNIKYNNDNLTNKFDVITCIDVTEHLPEHIYKKGIKEIFRVLKPRGTLILMQGNTTENPEHINVLSENQLVQDFLDEGFKLIERLPDRHYKLTK
jgi:2-polyprenyl-3-methyl-5-hydroxy-6-metoxy-1,4-benzoquinol methylase